MNPYDFVRFGEPARQEKYISHGQFKGESGSLLCRLTARTHIFIPQSQDENLQRKSYHQVVKHQELSIMRGTNTKPFLPGSSLKGVLRSVTEALSGSCLTLPLPQKGEGKEKGKVEYRDRPPVLPVLYKIPPGFEHCRDPKRLCPACRLFGFQSGENSFLGKVSISDAVAISQVETETLTIEALMEPKPRHRIWYENSGQQGVMGGRKFYYHQPSGPRTTEKIKYNKTVEAVPPGTIFEFTVDYTNLTDDEVALLIFILTLEEPMCHKVGMGKPVSLGSVKIEIIGWKKINRKTRYEQLGEGLSILKDEPLINEIFRWQKLYREYYSNWQESLSDLRRIWTWAPESEAEIRYPSREWFRKNPNVTLENVP